jgi:hypothetical protein
MSLLTKKNYVKASLFVIGRRNPESKALSYFKREINPHIISSKDQLSKSVKGESL